jgi:asparagine synthetase B (glutamine-hydrolysing)
METKKFGEQITYIHKNKTIQNDISGFVKENKFTSYSPEGITSYLTFRHPIHNTTMFSGYSKIPFGMDEKQTLWYPKFGGCNDNIELAINKIETLLLESIKELTKDFDKIAVTISGGVDSSLIAAMLRKIYPNKELYSYCAGFYGDDEFEYAKIVAEENNFIHKEIKLGKDDFIGENSIIKDLIEFKGAPLHPNELPLAIIEKQAKSEGMQIVLCGEGADDIFGGYGQNFRMYQNYTHSESFFKYFLNNYRYFSISDRDIIKDEYLVDDISLVINNIDPHKIPFDIRNWAIYFTQKFHTPGLITRGANAMRFNNLPLAFPFIQDNLVNYVNSLPFEYKVAWKTQQDEIDSNNQNYKDISEKYDIPKMILKKLAEKYLNFKIIYRPKKGFPVPFDAWLKDLNKWDLNQQIFKSTDISKYSAWKKFMLINLSIFIDIFEKHQQIEKK